MARLLYTEQFVSDMAQIDLASKREQVLDACDRLASFPLMGTADMPLSLLREYGRGIRKLVVRPFTVVYEYVEETDEVHVLGLVYGRAVR